MFKLQLDENKTFLIKNPKLKGVLGANIKSKMNDFATAGIESLKDSSNPKVRAFFAKALTASVEGENIALSEALNKMVYEDIDVTYELLKSNNFVNLKLLFELIIDVIEYYQTREGLDPEISSDDFNDTDILKVLRVFAKEDENNLQDFLNLVAVQRLEAEEEVLNTETKN